MKYLLLSISCIILIFLACCRHDEEKTSGKSTAQFNPNITYDTVRDIDGNIYKTLSIGNQTWMAENLRTTHYRNGDLIPNIKGDKDLNEWNNRTSGALCSYKNTTDLDSIATFGYLYNGYAIIDTRNIAPEGWHIPTETEWDSLETVIAAGEAITDIYGNAVAGGKMKEAGSVHWGYANHADNSSGFTALPGGFRQAYQGSFNHIGYQCMLWSSTSNYTNSLMIREMSPDFFSISRSQIVNNCGLSVRCIKNK
jgi:uncharacterized protein (TIGR02145 family)